MVEFSPIEKRVLEKITDIEGAREVLNELKRKAEKIRDYVYRVAPVHFLQEAESILQRDDLPEEVKVLFMRAAAVAIFKYLKL